MSNETKAEIKNINQITKVKENISQDVYFEDIYTFPIELNCQKERDTRKKRNMEIGLRLQEEREQAKWDKLEQRQAATNKRNRNSSMDNAKEGADGVGMMGSG